MFKQLLVFVFQDVFVPGPNEKALYTAEPLSLEDLTLLAELFYLPYEYGPKALHMLKEFNWLRANSSTVSVNCEGKEPEKVGLGDGGIVRREIIPKLAFPKK